MNQPRYRTLRFGITRVALSEGAPGVRYMQAEQPLQIYSQRITDRLKLWAMTRPDQTFMARRARLADGSLGDWIHLTYAQAWDSARSIAQALLDRKLSVERPVVILSENDLEHAQLALGCLVAGVPFVPTSPPYSLISQDYDKLRHVLRTVTPGLLFAADAKRYGKAIAAVASAGMEVVLTSGTVEGVPSIPFADLLATPANAAHLAKSIAQHKGGKALRRELADTGAP